MAWRPDEAWETMQSRGAAPRRRRPWHKLRPRLPLRLKGAEFALVVSLSIMFALAPVWVMTGVRERLNSVVVDWEAFESALASDASAPTGPVTRRLLTQIDPSIARRIQQRARITPEERMAYAEKIDSALAAPGLFLPDDFAAIPGGPHAAAFPIDRADPSQARRRNLSLLHLAYPDVVRPPFPYLFLKLLIAQTTYVASALILVDAVGRTPLYQVGVHRRGWLRSATFGLALLVVWFPMVFAANYWVRQWIARPSSHPAEQFLLVERGHGPAAWIVVLLALTVVGPLAEELTFRGLLQGYLNKRAPAAAAIAFSAVLFGFFHSATWPDPIPLILLGIGLGFAYQQTRSLWAPTAMHVGFNAIMVGLSPLSGPRASVALAHWLSAP